MKKKDPERKDQTTTLYTVSFYIGAPPENQGLQEKVEPEQGRRYIPGFSAFGRLRWEDCEFGASLGYTVNACRLDTQNNEDENVQRYIKINQCVPLCHLCLECLNLAMRGFQLTEEHQPRQHLDPFSSFMQLVGYHF